MSITAKVIADSKNEHGNRITTFVLTYPRIIHAELLTHRLFSRNAASSRAIPTSKMIKEVEENPFIPVAFQKAHKGMQGTEYFEFTEASNLRIAWLEAKNNAVRFAKAMNGLKCTKQLINRTLEPYQWYTCIVTATEYDNFFELRCPQYGLQVGDKEVFFKSEKDILKANPSAQVNINAEGILWKLKNNRGAGEIHISLLAEAMWDAMNESTPKQLKAGEWHIPFGDKMDKSKLVDLYNPKVTGKIPKLSYDEALNQAKVKIATARCARVSYLNFEGKDDYEADIKLYDRLLKEGHMSPFEHCARAMSKDEFRSHIQGVDINDPTVNEWDFSEESFGWSGNFRGFVQLRKEIE
jgi:thymidylate synthase ThyX